MVFNNTLYGNSAGIGCGQRGDFIGGCTYKNNHLIGTNPAASVSACDKQITPPCIQDHNLAQTVSAANNDGYSATSASPWSPTSGSKLTIGTGTNLSSYCFDNLTALCQSSSVGVGYDALRHAVVAPSRSQVTRPVLGPWDIGAYENPR